MREPFVKSPPDFIKELCDSSLMRKENSFSKFINATYAFNSQDGTESLLREIKAKAKAEAGNKKPQHLVLVKEAIE